MSKLYACLISPETDKAALIAVATDFAYRIELLDDGILFDISGLEKLIGTSTKIAAAILETMEAHQIAGSLAVNPNLETAILLARQGKGFSVTRERVNEINNSSALLSRLPLENLPLETEKLKIFRQLGFRELQDLQKIPAEDLLSRYGKDFLPLIDLINENPRRILVPNLKNDFVGWESKLETSLADFEQLMCLIELALAELFPLTLHNGLTTELIEICLFLETAFLEDESSADVSTKLYQVRASRPTLDKSFWLKIIYLKLSSEPPNSAIKNLKITVRFTEPRPAQKGLFAVVRPEPESLQLTVNKLKKLVGEKQVGVPVLLNERLPEPFMLDADQMPEGVEKEVAEVIKPSIGFYYFVPPLEAQVLIRRKQLIYLKTSRFAGRVANYSGVWKRNSRWWNNPWKTYEWDVELENAGVYRLCRKSQDWLVIGEYD